MIILTKFIKFILYKYLMIFLLTLLLNLNVFCNSEIAPVRSKNQRRCRTMMFRVASKYCCVVVHVVDVVDVGDVGEV